jgi:hypothetical protein
MGGNGGMAGPQKVMRSLEKFRVPIQIPGYRTLKKPTARFGEN